MLGVFLSCAVRVHMSLFEYLFKQECFQESALELLNIKHFLKWLIKIQGQNKQVLGKYL